MLHGLHLTPDSHLHLCPQSVKQFKGVILGNPILAAVAAGIPLAESVPLPKFKQPPQLPKQGRVGKAALPVDAKDDPPAVPPTKWDRSVMGEGETVKDLVNAIPTSPTSPMSSGNERERQRSRSPSAASHNNGEGRTKTRKLQWRSSSCRHRTP